MPRTPDHLVAVHELARQRVAAGKPSWEHQIDVSHVFHNDAMSFTEIRDAVVRILRTSTWVKQSDEFGRLVEIVDNLADVKDADEFDGWWDELYDEADYGRVWIKTQ